MATLDAHLVALDQKTGKVVWDVQVDDPTAGYSLTIAPLAYKGMIIVGNSGAEYGVRGFVDAYNATDGKRVWRFWSIPDTGWEGKWSPTTPEGEKLNRDLNKEQADFAKYKDSWQRGGGSTWMTPAVDPATDTIFIVVGNPSPDLDGSIRPGDNLYTESMVALDVKTGKYEWSPVAYSPDTRMVYVLGLHQPMNYITHSAPFDRGKLWLGSAFVAIPGEEQSGTFTAIDVNTGKIAWQNKLPDPLIGGALATAGGLVFTGGDGTGNFYAFDARTGKELWRVQCGAGVNAAPISFEVDGEQFIAVAAGR